MRKVMFLFSSAVIAIALSVTLRGDDQSQSVVQVRTGMVPSGMLGRPLGQLVLLEGTRAEGFKAGVCTLKVEKIDGNTVKPPVLIWIDNLDLPANQPCVLRGYETMRMIGSAPAYEQLAQLNNQPPPSKPQAGWQILCSFVALEAVEPKSLKMREPGT